VVSIIFSYRHLFTIYFPSHKWRIQ
jgi:hypothetical protein